MSKWDEDKTENRRAAEDLVIKQAIRGDRICGAYLGLKDLARRVTPGGDFLVGTQYDYGDEDDGIRPY